MELGAAGVHSAEGGWWWKQCLKPCSLSSSSSLLPHCPLLLAQVCGAGLHDAAVAGGQHALLPQFDLPVRVVALDWRRRGDALQARQHRKSPAHAFAPMYPPNATNCTAQTLFRRGMVTTKLSSRLFFDMTRRGRHHHHLLLLLLRHPRSTPHSSPSGPGRDQHLAGCRRQDQADLVASRLGNHVTPGWQLQGHLD